MKFGLTDEQVMIQDSARRFIAEHMAGRSGRRGMAPASWEALAELGFLALGLPERFGGIGGAVEMALVCQEFGRGPLLLPYASSAIFASQLLLRAGDDEQTATILPQAAMGKLILSVAYREADTPDQGAPLLTTARSDGDSYLLTGQKALVLAAGDAGLLIVSAAIEDIDQGGRHSLFLVDPKQPGVTMTPLALIDGSACAEVYFDRVRLSRSSLLGAPGHGADHLRHALRFATLGACSEVAGAASRALQITIDHLKTRKQFGSPLADFQALRTKIANMAMDCEMAQAAILRLLASFQDPTHHDPDMAVAITKVVVDEIGQRVCSEAIQLHGGMGLTEEAGIGDYYARAVLNRSLFGSTARRLEEYAALLASSLKQTAATGPARDVA